MASRPENPARRTIAPSGTFPRGLSRAGGLFALALCLGCLGGTGTDTENGLEPFSIRIVDPANRPVSGLRLEVQDAAARVDSTAENVLLGATGSLVTDSAGTVQLRFRRAGLFVLEGRRADSLLLIDTLRIRVAPGSKEPLFGGLGDPTLKTGVPVRAAGRLTLRSGYLLDSGRVYLRGSSLAASVEPDGSYDFGLVPVSAEKLTVATAYSARPAAVRYVKLDAHDAGVSVLTGTDGPCLADSTAAAAAADTADASLESPDDVARLAGRACAGREGTLIRVLRSDAAGATLSSLGEYLVPVEDAVPADSSALPISCLDSARRIIDGAVLDLENGTLVVDDLKRGEGCAPAAP